MLVTILVGVFHHVPNNYRVWVQLVVCFAPECRVPQVCVALAVSHGSTGYHSSVIFGNKQLSACTLHNLSEEYLVWNISFRFQYVVLSQQFLESLKVLFCAYYLCLCSALVGVVYSALQLFVYSFLGRMAVQRVVYAHPVNRVVARLPQLLVSHHFLAHVAHLYKQHPVVQLSCQRSQHLAQQLVFLCLVAVNPFAQYSAVYQQEWRQQQRSVSHYAQHVAQFAPAFIGNHHHIRPLSWRSLAYLHQLPAVEKAAFLQFWHAFGLGVYGGSCSFHTAKLLFFS